MDRRRKAHRSPVDGHSATARPVRAGTPWSGTTQAAPHAAEPRTAVEEGCLAARITDLVDAGTDRVAVLQLAEDVLMSPDCAADAECTWAGLLALICADNLVAAAEHCDRLDRRSQEVGSGRHGGVARLARARIDMLSGRPADAARTLTSLLGQEAAGPVASLVGPWLVEALVQSGDVDRAREALRGIDPPGPGAGGALGRAHALAARAAVHLAAGRFNHAVDDYRSCGRVLGSAGVHNPAVIPWRATAALGAVAVRRFDLAAVLAEEDLAAARRWGAPRAVGRALRALALARRDSRSVALLGEAAELFDLARATDEVMRTLFDLGLLHAERGDVPACRGALEVVGELARVHDNGLWRDRTAAALARLAPRAEPVQLTEQELRTARLAVTGYTNRQIAETMNVQQRTVEFHLSSTYRKLGISGRRELPESLGTVVCRPVPPPRRPSAPASRGARPTADRTNAGR
ncbi:LuxR C-terminal-related transcriptional regulator [Saccharothrix saharensis]|uniref:helix-turn-helix transcriptional regulator n=1 Tax=Saccharothrix saharensis TaxID=571190 RepID=UPI0036AF4D68